MSRNACNGENGETGETGEKSLTIFFALSCRAQRRCHAKSHDLVHEFIKGDIK